MGNTYKIIWSEEALSNLKSIISYLEKRWTKREITKFARLLDQNIVLIKENPQIFPRSEIGKGYRRAVISKQVSIYYMIDDHIVNIISVFDNRQNPIRLKKS